MDPVAYPLVLAVICAALSLLVLMMRVQQINTSRVYVQPSTKNMTFVQNENVLRLSECILCFLRNGIN